MLNNKAFTILGAIISILILSFCMLSINIFLLQLSNYLRYLQVQHKDFNIKRSMNSCLAAGYEKDICPY